MLEESEVHNSGLIKNAIHIPRGLIEFKSADISSLIDDETHILVYFFLVQKNFC